MEPVTFIGGLLIVSSVIMIAYAGIANHNAIKKINRDL